MRLDCPFASDDKEALAPALAAVALSADREARIDLHATALISAIRERGGLGGVEELLREYALDTREGLALMVLAEALLRVPDDATADRLIEDRLGAGTFGPARPGSSLLIGASAWALGLSVHVIQPGETPDGVLGGLIKRLGSPAVREATRAVMRLMGGHFVLGQSITKALDRAQSRAGRVFRYSFDMLGEGARTADDANRYFLSYSDAIDAIGRAAGNQPLPNRPGISVKLSALHPRYEAVSRYRVLEELVPRVTVLARAARAWDLNFTVDAEEQDRLELSLDVISAVLADSDLAGWDGFGLAIQAYGKRAPAVIDYVVALAQDLERRLMVRLVKGAYWDTEIKRAQERGLSGYPVFTSKAATDLSYLACADRLLAARPTVYPQFATHNALTVSTIVEHAGAYHGSGGDGYEFQRLHGMGDALYARLRRDNPGVAVRTYAPVGGHADLLAYLVRRLLENGANSSFVSMVADPAVPITRLLIRPQTALFAPGADMKTVIPPPGKMYPDRKNSVGVEFGVGAELGRLLDEVAQAPPEADPPGADPDVAMRTALAAFSCWSTLDVDSRAVALERTADAFETSRGMLLALLVSEGGKTLDDALSEYREAVDFLRYYAAQARTLFIPEVMPGPTGETNTLGRQGRGVWLCISPWNFPLAIFVGQVAAALVSGNVVIAKPAPQTPRVAAAAVRLLHASGVPAGVLTLAPGGVDVGTELVAHPMVAGVAFTGSTTTAWSINRALAAKNGPIVPLVAETGGINAMIVDATALPEQVTDDVVTSAFRSAGQRCSALRLLCVQSDIADRLIDMISGAAAELRVGDPADPATHIGPVIDRAAKARLDTHIAHMRAVARTHFVGAAPPGCYVAPHVFEIASLDELSAEVFGPVLHVLRWRTNDFSEMAASLASKGYGLTLGVQSRNESFIADVIARVPAGNVYVNRSMIGAVVGTQPFGGLGLSGTGPKAGGPDYLRSFTVERTVTVNTAAAGGNVALLASAR